MTAADAISDELFTRLRTVDNPYVRGEEGRVNILTHSNTDYTREKPFLRLLKDGTVNVA